MHLHDARRTYRSSPSIFVITATFCFCDGFRKSLLDPFHVDDMYNVVPLCFAALVLSCIAFVLFYEFQQGIDMHFQRAFLSSILGSFATGAIVNNATVDLGWYAPKKSWINDLGQVLNGAGTHGFVFSGSQLPVGVEYGTYNWCNMPHVRKEEYVRAEDEFELVYVEV